MKKKLDYIREHNWTMLLLGIIVGLIISATSIYATTLVDSIDVIYDNSSSSLESSDVQNALDELYGMCHGETISTYITNLFNEATQTSVTTVGDESITQASSAGLMKDSHNGIRYYGSDPDNYVYFNDELWRIIGVFSVSDENGTVEKRVKIIRNESIGSFEYDMKNNGVGTSTSDFGSNSWTDARLMMLLNPGYEDGATDSNNNNIYTYEGSLYWNSKSGTCYTGITSAGGVGTGSCDFTDIGLGDNAKNMIGQAKYYLGGFSNYALYYEYADDFYTYERYGSAYSSNETTWIGYIGLIYVSDYAYAVDLSTCTYNAYYYSSSPTNCLTGNWMYNMKGDSIVMWTLTPQTGGSEIVNAVLGGGYVSSMGTYSGYGVWPVVYLNADVTIVSGEGTNSSPYILE